MTEYPSIEDRYGRAYELAGKVVACGADPGARLVHGSIEGMGNPRHGHAWVILVSGLIYDAVLDDEFEPGRYEAFFGTVVDAIYAEGQVVAAMLASGHWGPWNSPGEQSADGSTE